MGVEHLEVIERDLNRKEISYDTSHNVVVSNDFILHSASNLTLNEMKLLRLIITQCERHDEKFYTFSLKAKDFAKLLDVDPHDMRKHLKTMTRHIMAEVLEIEDVKTGDWLQFHWTETCAYKAGVVTIKIADSLAPYMLNLKKRFTLYKLEEILPFKSAHALKIYEVLIANINQHEQPHADKYSVISVSLETLRIVTKTQDKYPRFNNFNTRVLTPAVNEINRVSKYHVIATPYRNGHAVCGIDFLVESQVGYAVRTKNTSKNVKVQNDNEQLEGQMNILDFQDTDGNIKITRS